jgi:hypothetical protein
MVKNVELEFTLAPHKTFVNDVLAQFLVNDVLALITYWLRGPLKA